MDKDEVLESLKRLSVKLGPDKVVRLEDVRTIPRLSYYVDLHFGKLGNALKALNLSSTPLANKMNVTNEELLSYLTELQKKLEKRPTTLDLRRDSTVYKKFANNRFSPNIFKSRFGGFRNALLQISDTESELKTKKSFKKLEETNLEFFQNKPRFFGKGAELHVTAELLYRGFQAANIPVDEGLDILAVRDRKTFYFQVKHIDLANSSPIKVTRSSFERKAGGDVYYIFVLLNDKIRDFLIVPYHIINDWIRTGLAEEKEKGYIFHIKKTGNEYELSGQDITKYCNRWDDIK